MDTSDASRDLTQLQAAIEQLENELSEKKQQAVKIAHFIEMAGIYGGQLIQKKSPSERRYEPGFIVGLADSATASAIVAGDVQPPKNVRVAIEILRANNRPMKTTELIHELSSRGITIGGKTPVTNLSSALSRFKKLLKADRSEGWKLLEWFPTLETRNGTDDNVERS